MAEKFLPLRYHLEIYLNSTASDPIYFAQCETPFVSFNVGDFLDHRTIGDLPIVIANGSTLKIASVGHILWTIEGSHVSQKLMVVVEVAKNEQL